MNVNTYLSVVTLKDLLHGFINVTFSRQCSNVLLFGISRLRLSRERNENRLYIDRQMLDWPLEHLFDITTKMKKKIDKCLINHWSIYSTQQLKWKKRSTNARSTTGAFVRQKMKKQNIRTNNCVILRVSCSFVDFLS